jgi:hypothetical protein
LGRGLQDRGRGFDIGSITVPDRTLQRQKEPSATYVFCKLRPSFSVTAEVAGSSPVVPAIHSKRVNGMIIAKKTSEIGCKQGASCTLKSAASFYMVPSFIETRRPAT